MPERFLGNWPKDAFIPFSQSVSCLLRHGNQLMSTLQVLALVWGDGASFCGIIESTESSQFLSGSSKRWAQP